MAPTLEGRTDTAARYVDGTYVGPHLPHKPLAEGRRAIQCRLSYMGSGGHKEDQSIICV